MLTHLLFFLSALTLTLVLTPLARAAARRVGVLDSPDGVRKLHATPVPKLGGVAVFVAYFGTLWVGLRFAPADVAGPASELAAKLFGPALLVLALGIVDDLRGARPIVKLAVQLVAAAWVCTYPDLRILTLTNPLGESSVLGMLSIPATVFWIILVTNAFNIVDGMDGLASGVAFVATVILYVTSLQRDLLMLALVAAPLGGGLLGFLRYNFNPASIFLGDSGSLWLGFVLSVLAIAGSQKSSTAIALAAPLLTFALPVVETVTSTLRRFLSGRPIFEADSGHIHHQLQRQGLSARQAALLLYLASGVFGACSLLFINTNAAVVGVTTLALGVLAWWGIQRLGYYEFDEIGHALRRGLLYQRTIVRNSIVTRRLPEALAECVSMDEAWPNLVEVVQQLGFVAAELRLDRGGASDAVDVRAKAWRVASDRSVPEVVFAVHLLDGGARVGELVLARPANAGPLHSELALLVDATSRALPPLVRLSKSTAAGEDRLQEPVATRLAAPSAR